MRGPLALIALLAISASLACAIVGCEDPQNTASAQATSPASPPVCATPSDAAPSVPAPSPQPTPVNSAQTNIKVAAIYCRCGAFVIDPNYVYHWPTCSLLRGEAGQGNHNAYDTSDSHELRSLQGNRLALKTRGATPCQQCRPDLDPVPDAEASSSEDHPDRPVASSQASSPTGTVYITRTGECYHRAGCSYLRQSAIPIDRETAIQNYRPCSRCKP